MKICVFTLGCKVNQYESDGIINGLIARGHDVSAELGPADVYILNTCAVTSLAERKSRQLIARARRYNPDARILVCGCAGQKNAKSFLDKGVDFVIGNGEKLTLVDFDNLTGSAVKPCPLTYESGYKARPERVRTYVKIQDGCNNFCSYCIVPYLRGRSRSRDMAEAVQEIKSVKGEVVLTGIDISDYGVQQGKSLTDLIVALDGYCERVRLGSLEVRAITPGLLDALAALPGFCPHFHLSLQSGSDTVLKTMNRHYTTAEYFEKVSLIRDKFPNASITTDVIVGFSTESEDEFNQSMAFLKKVGYSDVHVFPYSVREGTAAAKIKPLPPAEVERRRDIALGIKEELKSAYVDAQIGKTLSVLIEEECDGQMVGYSENYVRVYADAGKEIGKVYSLTATERYLDGVRAKDR